MVLAKQRYNLRGRELGQPIAEFVPFSATTRMSGIEVDGRSIHKGAVDAIAPHLEEHGSRLPQEVRSIAEGVARQRGTPPSSPKRRALGVICLRYVVKEERRSALSSYVPWASAP